MKYRKIGRWPLELSEISLGTGDNAGGLVYASTEQQLALVHRALDLGVNTFDASPDYGKGLGEANLGRTLRDLGARDAIISTKVEIMPEELGRMGEKVRESINDSLLRLGRDYVDVLMLHNPVRDARNPNLRLWTPLTEQDIVGEILPALEQVVRDGKARFLGLATEAAQTPAVDMLLGTGRFALLNVWFNLANASAAMQSCVAPEGHDYCGLFASAERHGAGVAVIRPLAGGALTSNGLRKARERHALSRGYFDWSPEAWESEVQRASHFAFLDKPGRTISEAAVRYILDHFVVSTVIGGFSEIAHLEEAVAAAEAGPLSEDDNAQIREVLERVFKSVAASKDTA